MFDWNRYKRNQKRKGVNEMYDLMELAGIIAELCCDERGYLNEEITDREGNTIIVRGEYEKDEYQEDDYFNGTGAWVCRNAEVDITEFDYYNKDYEDVELSYGIFELQEAIENELMI